MKRREAIAPLVLTDNSPALIKSVCETFNNCSISVYINWTFDILIKKSENQSTKSCMKTCLILCQSHFFKNIVRKCDEIISGEKNCEVKQLFLFCFTLLQNSSFLEEFNEIFRSFFIIFNQESIDAELKDMIDFIKKLIKIRNIDLLENFHFENVNYKKKNQLNPRRSQLQLS